MKTCALVLAISCLLLPGVFRGPTHVFHGNAAIRAGYQVAETKWSGTVKQTIKGIGDLPGMEKTDEAMLEVMFTDAVPSLYRQQEVDDTSTLTDNKGHGTFQSSGDHKIIGPKGVVEIGHFDCFGVGPSELHTVGINQEAGTYDIEVMGPDSKCNGETRYPMTGDVIKSNSDVGSGQIGNSITISQQPLGKNPNVLSGSISEKWAIPGLSHGTREITWSLYRGSVDAELIITPSCGKSTVSGCSYDTWLPEPGADEMRKGSVMNIGLRLQRKGGGAPPVKADHFELTLAATSSEPGITINYPLQPNKPGLPDLRLIGDPGIESADADQKIDVGTVDGINGTGYVASYDGGGYTVLTATAVLEDKRRIVGNLLVSGGPRETQIPKRGPGSVIALAWLNANGNPKDPDDVDKSQGNTNNGDGLSAYEEYRGVISEGKFRRLDPRDKDLAVNITRADLQELAGGIRWFEAASDLSVVRFLDSEVPATGWINSNSNTAHIFDQAAVPLRKGSLPAGQLGNTFTRSVANVDIPSGTLKIVVDPKNISQIYQSITQNAGAPVPYTYPELLAATVAHELAHSVNVPHHGDEADEAPWTVADNKTKIFDWFGKEIVDRPFKIEGLIGIPGSGESGDMSCIMAYNPYYNWAHTVGSDGTNYYYKVPLMVLGQRMCRSRVGTGINKPDANPQVMNRYFGKAVNGNCLGLIKMK